MSLAVPDHWQEQIDAWNKGKPNCPPQPRWKFWRGQHRWTENGAPMLNTFTYSYAVVCKDCGRVGVIFAAY